MIKNLNKAVYIYWSFIFAIICFLSCTIIFSGCTISVTTLHTQGTASDVVDENASVTPTIDANAEIPITPKL